MCLWRCSLAGPKFTSIVSLLYELSREKKLNVQSDVSRRLEFDLYFSEEFWTGQKHK